MGIPLKFASRGISVIPIDFLDCDDELCDENMHWSAGEKILKAAQFVSRHKQLFGCYVTNFSCGPDSFLQRFFRDIMGRKPSLTLEIDSHTADAGVNTRIEAFLNIVERFRKMKPSSKVEESSFNNMQTICSKDGIELIKSDGNKLNIKDSQVKFILPSMGELPTEAVAKALESSGINTIPLPEPNFEILKRGRANTSCKECLPLILITGMMDEYIEKYKSPEEVSLFFVPTAGGGCRLGQYKVFLQKFIEKKKFENVGLLSLTNENGYEGFDQKTMLKVLQAIIISDIWDDIKNTVCALAYDKEKGLTVFYEQWNKVLSCFGSDENMEKVLKDSAQRLRDISLKKSYNDAPKVLLAGEIYVRKERFSSGSVVKTLTDRGIVVKTSPVNEWMFYTDYMIEKGVFETRYNFFKFLKFLLTSRYKRNLDAKYRRIMSESGLFDFHSLDIDKIIEYGRKLISIHIGGDPILSCGTAMKDILQNINGVVIMGPFACMQSRTTEAILSEFFTPEKKSEIEKNEFQVPDGISGFPFLAIETDGNVLPQLIEAKLEAFALQVERNHLCLNGKYNGAVAK